MGSYSFIDHTGDCGLDVEASSVADAFQTLVSGFMDLLLDRSGGIEARDRRSIDVSGLDQVDTMIAFANEILFLFETEGFLVADVEVRKAERGSVSAILRGERMDRLRHTIARPVKAVTHHAARFEEDARGGIRARVIFDL